MIDAIQGLLISLGISARPEFTESTVHSPQFFARGSDVLVDVDHELYMPLFVLACYLLRDAVRRDKIAKDYFSSSHCK